MSDDPNFDEQPVQPDPSADQPDLIDPNDLSGVLPRASSLQQIIGGLIFGADRPLSLEDIRKCLQEVAAANPEDEAAKVYADASPRDVQDVIEGLAKLLDRMGVGLSLVERQGGWRFQSQPAVGLWLRHFLKAGRPQRLSRSSLETLAIIAYRQPVSKSEIEAIRGVGVDHLVKGLMELHLIRIVGRSELPGRPFLYGTTSAFLDHFGLRNLGELNAMDPTLQRSKPAERKKVHFKEKPKPAEKEPEPGVISEQIAAEFKAEETVKNIEAEPDVDDFPADE